MGIQLEPERTAGLPVVKRTALGQKFHGAIIKVDQRDRLKRNDATQQMEPVLKHNGKPRQELVVTCLVLPGSTAPVGIGDDEHTAQPEEVVRLILKGKSFADWIQSKNELGRPVQVGDVVSQVTDSAQAYDAQGNPSGSEITDQATLSALPRGKSVGIYGPITVREPKPGSEWLAKAEAAYHNMHQPIAAETTTGESEVVQDDEPPF